MSIAIGPDEVELGRIARSALESRGGIKPAHSSLDAEPDSSGVWSLVSELGWLGLPVEERFGGQGAGLGELLVVIEELGRIVATGPVLSTSIAAVVLQQGGTDDQRAQWLPDICAGSTPVAVGLGGELAVGDGAVNGSAGAVLSASDADLLLLTVGDDIVIVRRDDAVKVSDHRGLDTARTVGVVELTSAPVLDTLVGAAALARRTAVVLASAEAVGGMAACTEQAVAYAKTREQFGKPIGTFMAVKHHASNMLVDTELATASVWDASRGSATDAEAELVAATAGGVALPAYERVARMNIQLHGGIAFTWEHTAHLHLRRAIALAALFGRPEEMLRRITDLTRDGVERKAQVELPPEAAQLRDETKAFVARHLALPESERRVDVARAGYLVPHWPTPFGRGAGIVEQIVIDEELADVDRPDLGLGGWILPAVLLVATEEQTERWMWDAVEGKTRWCQLFSEPGAGSDAAGVSTKGVKVDGGWRVTGQKVWTSDAANCQWGLATIRTDTSVPKHAGITAMAIDMSAEGVDVRPLREITGDHFFNEVFFDNVFVPDSDVVGEPGGGWGVAISTLGFERVTIGNGFTSFLAQELVPLLDRYTPDDDGLATRIGALIAQSASLGMLNQRSAARAMISANPGAEGTIAKLVGAEHQQHVSELGLEIAGVAALVGEEPRLVRDSFYTRCLTLAGGTSEIVRTTIAERMLGLPRDK
ncbi:MAG: Acyl-CoA dehydrogenase FadE34 [Aeromicrobium sp.]|nr:Acyl-CoA dehydrogenase FadE34 [Aeromicrobium sp.]